MIRVAIVEDEMLVRLGLRMCLESSPDIYVAGAFASAEEAEAGQDKAPGGRAADGYSAAGQLRVGTDAAAAEEIPADAVRRAELL